MAHMSFLMKDEGNRERLLSADSVESVLRLFDSVK
jgi:mannitol/fructose-specific phosphotransferase system IIA component (Ntr-type)